MNDRLEQEAEECVRLAPRSATQAAKLLRRRLVANKDLRRALADRFMDQNIAAVIAVVRGDAAANALGEHLAAKGQSIGTDAGQFRRDTLASLASAGSEGGGGQPGNGAQRRSATPSTTSRTAPPAAPRRLGPSAFVQQSVARGLLDTFLVNGQPLGDLTGRDVREAARNQHVKAGFLIRVANGVPDTMQVRKAWTEADLARFYGEATHDAARGIPLTKPIIEATKPDGYSEAHHA